MSGLTYVLVAAVFWVSPTGGDAIGNAYREADGGDTILVEEGCYEQQKIVDGPKGPVHIKAITKDAVLLGAQMGATNVTLDGFSVVSVYVEDARNLTLQNLWVPVEFWQTLDLLAPCFYELARRAAEAQSGREADGGEGT